MYTIIQLSLFLLPLLQSLEVSLQLTPGCDYYQEVLLGQEYYIYNQQYPRNYPRSTSCLWTASSPVGTIMVISCDDVQLPFSKNCQNDRLLFSLVGDASFQKSEYYCGNNTLTIYTQSNSLAVGLYSSSTSSGGKFLCTLTAMRAPPRTCNCGLREQTKIVGGQETGVNEYPLMAALLNIETREAFCGASIISEWYALTAAHCLLHVTPKILGLLVGDHNLSTGADTATAQLYPLNYFVQHPSYDSTTEHNDIAVLRTLKKIVFNMAVGAVCLPFKYRDSQFVNEKVTVLGWGFTDFSGLKSDTLMEAELNVVSNAQCDAALVEQIWTTQVCTFASGKDSCLSDSGGPVIFQDRGSGNLELIGIISYGVGCATAKPAVNTRVTTYLPWIISVTSDASYCIK